jgi:hypothetical protein
MTYIIQHDFNQEVPYFVRVVNNTTFEEIYDPQQATQFKTKKEAQKWIDFASRMKTNSKVVEYQESVQQFLDWANNGMVRRTLNCINRIMSRPYNNESLEEVIDWWIYSRHNESEIDFDDYKTWPKLYSISKHLFEVNGYHSDDYKETYISFEIYSNKDGQFKDFETELNMVLDKVTLKDKEGYLVLPIFDHYLCEHGNSVSLLIHPETKKVKIGAGRWRQDEFSSLEDAFNYIKTERWYE